MLKYSSNGYKNYYSINTKVNKRKKITTKTSTYTYIRGEAKCTGTVK